MISVVAGERTAENVVAVVNEFKRRTGGRLMDLITTDGYLAYEDALLEAYGETITPPRTGKRGRPRAPDKVAPKGLTYAVVEKTREKGRVVAIATRVVFGTMAAAIAAPGMSRVSRSINTSFVERQNGTDRHRNARKARKTYRFSEEPGDGGRVGGSSLVNSRMAGVPIRATLIGHEVRSAIFSNAAGLLRTRSPLAPRSRCGWASRSLP